MQELKEVIQNGCTPIWEEWIRLIISNLKDVGITTLSPLNIKPFCTVSSSRTSKYIIADGGTSYFLFGQPFWITSFNSSILAFVHH
jgi:hypothetical protein